MHVDWTGFAQVVVVSFGVAVALIVLFAVGVGLLSPTPGPIPDPRAETATDTRADTRAARAPLARRLTAWSCFLACALCVAYGLYLIVAK
jgi:hypothetical protein